MPLNPLLNISVIHPLFVVKAMYILRLLTPISMAHCCMLSRGRTRRRLSHRYTNYGPKNCLFWHFLNNDGFICDRIDYNREWAAIWRCCFVIERLDLTHCHETVF